ncbi:MAG TPA: flavodoxin family protein [Methanomassiliicoccales archaeon]|nr:flavodoxin family protein [Methanomassiliicoccales archaeon]
MKILAINGSPRKDGNTARLLKEITKDHADVDLDYVDLNDLKIKDCQACYFCKKNDACALKDDMQRLYKKLREADALVIGSPVFFGVETANVRAFVDRLYALLAFGDGPGKYVPRLKGDKVAISFVSCGSGKGKEVYANIKDRHFAMWANLGFKNVHTFVIAGATPQGNVFELVDAQEMVKECQKLLEG